MSMALMVKVMKTKVGNPLRKLVLLKLADNANDQGEAWPSYSHIADQCEINRRSAIRHIKALEEEGFLSISHRKSGQGGTLNSSNIFILTLNRGGDTKSLGGSDSGSPGSDTESLGGGIESLGGSDTESPRTSHSFESVNESNSSNSVINDKKQTNTLIDSAFDRFWSAGLPKVGKQKALAAFLVNLKKSNWDAESFAELLTEDITHRLLANQFGFDKLHPTTYLSQRRWEDEKPEVIPFDRIVEAYHRNLPNNVPVTALSDRRREFLAYLWTQRANRELNWFDEFFAFCATQPGLNGSHLADLEWLTDPNNYPRITENARGQ